jgi:hypothetical protein
VRNFPSSHCRKVRSLIIKGEKTQDKEEKRKGYYLSERVVGVDNRLMLRPRIDLVDIQQRIEEALKRNAEVDAALKT